MSSPQCRGIILTVNRDRYWQLLWQFMSKRRYPQRRVPHRFGIFPYFIDRGERVYIISDSLLWGYCIIEDLDRELRCIYLDDWNSFMPPLQWWGFRGSFRYYHNHSQCLNPRCSRPVPRYCAATWDSFGNGPFCPSCLVNLNEF